MSVEPSSSSGSIREDWRVTDTTSRHPSTGPIFLQKGRMFVMRSGDLYAHYPGLTIRQYADLHGLDAAELLGLLNEAAEAEAFERGLSSGSPRGVTHAAQTGTAPVTGPIGYTGSFRERDPDIEDVSMVAALEARGPE